MKKIPILGAALLFAVSCGGCAAVFGGSLSADATDSQVVDADTGQPIEGAVVVAYWEMHRGSFAGDSLPCGAANVEEAVTDKDGKFHIPGWGPIRSNCDMRSFDPFLYVFKSGYGYTRVGNYPLDPPFVTSTHSEWNGKPIKLKLFPDPDLSKTGIKSYASNFGALNVLELANFIVNMPGQCNWKKFPICYERSAQNRDVLMQRGIILAPSFLNLLRTIKISSCKEWHRSAVRPRHL